MPIVIQRLRAQHVVFAAESSANRDAEWSHATARFLVCGRTGIIPVDKAWFINQVGRKARRHWNCWRG